MRPLPPDLRVWFPYASLKPRSRLRLFCFPYAGGGASLFREWGGSLPADLELFALQLPGREGRLKETPFTTLDSLLTALVQAIEPALEQPFAFFGHSMGALLAFELARRLRREGMPLPLHLFASAYRAPQLPRSAAHVHALPDAAFIEEVRSLNGTPDGVLENQELRQLFLPTLRADFAVCERYGYRAEEPLACPITALGGLRDQEVGRDAIMAWREHTTNAFKARFLPGDHFFLHSERLLVLQIILQELANSK